MNVPYTPKKLLTVASLSTLCLAASAFGQLVSSSTVFGTSGDGLDGFTESTTDGAWSTNTGNVQLVYDSTDNAGFQNAGLLKDFGPFSTGNGITINMSGTVTWSTYADDNNRIGLYAFGTDADANTNGAVETDALSFLLHIENGATVNTGIDGSTIGDDASAYNPPFTPGDNVDNLVVDFEISFDVAMVYDNLGNINFTFDLSYLNGDDPSTLQTDTVTGSVVASSVSGTHFGFAGRARDRGENRVDPDFRGGTFDARYQDFSFEVVPEPSSYALLAGVFAAMLILRRRRS